MLKHASYFFCCFVKNGFNKILQSTDFIIKELLDTFQSQLITVRIKTCQKTAIRRYKATQQAIKIPNSKAYAKGQ